MNFTVAQVIAKFRGLEWDISIAKEMYLVVPIASLKSGMDVLAVMGRYSSAA
ncbi:MAG: hypothetical protein AAFO95_22045 [Cyanobacteria bacterium J06600_6]